MWGVIREKAMWIVLKRWLDGLVKTLEGEKHEYESEVKEAQRLLIELGWKTPLNASKVVATNFIFTQLLGDVWISGDLVQLMNNCIVEQLKSNRNWDHVIIRGPEFAQSIKICVYKKYNLCGHKACLAKYATKIEKDVTQHLYVAANVNKNHWIVIHINYKP